MLEYLLYIKNNSITLQLKITTIELSNILWVKNSISFQMIRFISALHGWSYFMALLLVTSLWHSVSSFVASLSTWSLTIQRSSPHKSWSPKSQSITSVSFYWPKKVTKLPELHMEKNQVSHLGGRSGKVTL